jgi:hypothetical protein
MQVAELVGKAVTGAVLLKLITEASLLGYSIAVPTDARIPASGLAAFCVCPALEVNTCICFVSSGDIEVVLQAEWE